MRPAWLGWFLIVYGVACTLLAIGGSLYGIHARHVVRRATQVLDSLGNTRCVPAKPGDTIIQGRRLP